VTTAPPDVLVYPLDDARAQLAAAGYTAEVGETRPPGRGIPQGLRRVVRQRHEGNRVLLVVTPERHERAAPPTAPDP